MFDRLYQENWLEQVGNDDDEKRSIELALCCMNSRVQLQIGSLVVDQECIHLHSSMTLTGIFWSAAPVKILISHMLHFLLCVCYFCTRPPVYVFEFMEDEKQEINLLWPKVKWLFHQCFNPSGNFDSYWRIN